MPLKYTPYFYATPVAYLRFHYHAVYLKFGTLDREIVHFTITINEITTGQI